MKFRIVSVAIIVATLAGVFQPGFVYAAKLQHTAVDAALYSLTPVPLQPVEFFSDKQPEGLA